MLAAVIGYRGGKRISRFERIKARTHFIGMGHEKLGRTAQERHFKRIQIEPVCRITDNAIRDSSREVENRMPVYELLDAVGAFLRLNDYLAGDYIRPAPYAK